MSSAITTEFVSDTCVRLSCDIKASPERTFEAWTQPEQIVRWFVPGSGVACQVQEMDARVGGKFLITIHSDPPHIVSGEYLDLKAPNLISMSWRWISVPDGVTSRVTVQITAAEAGTRLSMTHDKLFDAESRDRHTEGWTACLIALTQILSS